VKHHHRVRVRVRAARLAIELITSRIEGEAAGIRMAKHHVTRVQAASLLRQASRERRRTLHEVAAEVVRSGDGVADEPPRAASWPERGHGAIRGC